MASSDAVTTAAPITAATRPVTMPSFHGKPRRGLRSGVRRPNGSSSSPHRATRSGPSPRAPTPVGCSARTAAPVPVRRVTRGATWVMTLVGRFRASVTRATMIGVTATASNEPRSQKYGTITAAATADRLEISSVESWRPPFSCLGSGLTPSTLAAWLTLHFGAGHDVVAAVGPAHPGLVPAVVVVAQEDQRGVLPERRARL